ncbi:MAG: hypothetical protein UU74_C0033G0002 [Candidatus Woesebacteria bacterium GW2011_GWA1_41_7]|uniref:Uncharacterized protein n=1 Tax=Candidatus Woesebacteria bacterium GW2011_GWA1_41_7 TaxID=1618556 RepID=A0A0G0WVL1_9BACT|nr:MAG: hypothetical protein UU74_C0033G0002 [Candidatus Woesebacteria bacterium GW2011_GWA1_41_7]
MNENLYKHEDDQVDKCKNPTWEKVAPYTYRLRVFNGWIVTTKEENETMSCAVFVPDPGHEWEICEE